MVDCKVLTRLGGRVFFRFSLNFSENGVSQDLMQLAAGTLGLSEEGSCLARGSGLGMV